MDIDHLDFLDQGASDIGDTLWHQVREQMDLPTASAAVLAVLMRCSREWARTDIGMWRLFEDGADDAVQAGRIGKDWQ